MVRPSNNPFVLLYLAAVLLPLSALGTVFPVITTTNTTVRVMAANLTSGTLQYYETPGLNIFKGLKPDIVAIQEFNYSSPTFGDKTSAAFKEMVTNTFGTNFVYYRETNSSYSIPNGIISRYPILNSGSWIDSDTGVDNRGYAWARIDLPGTNDLYVVSVHLKASSGATNETRRGAEATEIKNFIQSNFPSNAWIMVAGDMNLYSDNESAITTFKTFLSDSPVPADQNGNNNTSSGRSERYDRVLLSFSMTNLLTSIVMPSRTYPNGLVFDSRVYTPLSEMSPVQTNDSGASGMQHMGVVKALKITYTTTNFVDVTSPTLALSSTNIVRWAGVSNLTYSVYTSTNLPSWNLAGSASSATTNFSFTNQTGVRNKFYRVTYP